MIATELIYDEKVKSIIDFKDLDPKTLSMHFDTTLAKFVWVQYAENPQLRRVLFYDQVLITNK